MGLLLLSVNSSSVPKGELSFSSSSDLQYLDLRPTVLQHIVVSIPSPSTHGLADNSASYIQFWSPSAQPPLWGYTPIVSQSLVFKTLIFRLYGDCTDGTTAASTSSACSLEAT